MPEEPEEPVEQSNKVARRPGMGLGAGLAIGVGLGVALGAALGNVGVGVAIGAGFEDEKGDVLARWGRNFACRNARRCG
jgi:hypothetical protein